MAKRLVMLFLASISTLICSAARLEGEWKVAFFFHIMLRMMGLNKYSLCAGANAQ